MHDMCLPRMGKSSRRIEEPAVALVALTEPAAGMADWGNDGTGASGCGGLRRVALDVPDILGRFSPPLPLLKPRPRLSVTSNDTSKVIAYPIAPVKLVCSFCIWSDTCQRGAESSCATLT